MKSRQKNGRDSRSRETEVGEKIAVTTKHSPHTFNTEAPSFVSLEINTLDNHQGNHTHSHAFLTLKSLCFDDLALVTTLRPYVSVKVQTF